MEFKYYPNLYLLLNQPRYFGTTIDKNMENNPFPMAFFHRPKLELFNLFPLEHNVSGLTLYTDDIKLKTHLVNIKRDEVLMNKTIFNPIHYFEIEFIHPNNNIQYSENLEKLHKIKYTNFSDLNQDIIEKLKNGMELKLGKDKRYIKKVKKQMNIEFTNLLNSVENDDDISSILMDSDKKIHKKLINIRDMEIIELKENMLYGDWKRLHSNTVKNSTNDDTLVNVSKWIIKTHHPMHLWKLLRVSNIHPRSMKRIRIGNLSGINSNINDWRIMSEDEIFQIGKYKHNLKTLISNNAIMGNHNWPNIDFALYNKPMESKFLENSEIQSEYTQQIL